VAAASVPAPSSRWRLARALLAAAVALACGAPSCAHAQRLEARYVISMTGIRVGQSAWTVNIDNDRYSVSASGGSVDLLNVLLRAEGVARVSGNVRNDSLVPAVFSSTLAEDGEKIDLKVTFEEGTVTAVEGAPPPAADRVPLASSHLQGVSDPLSALLIADAGSAGVPAKESCEHTLAIFDGRRRYDLALSFNRMEKMRDKADADGGSVLVCNVILRPIAGHRADSMIMRYVAGRRDMEIAFAAILGSRFLAPFRLSVPTAIGTLAVSPTSFETKAPAQQAHE
jgi:hypothetical protein